jgi:hypothetical protein
MRAAEPLDCAGGGPVRNILIAAAHPSALACANIPDERQYLLSD